MTAPSLPLVKGEGLVCELSKLEYIFSLKEITNMVDARKVGRVTIPTDLDVVPQTL